MEGEGTQSILLHHNVFENVHITVARRQMLQENPNLGSSFHYFSIEGVIRYIGFAHDFGPMSLSCIYQFCKLLDAERNRSDQRPTAFLVQPSRRSVTNAVFLMGAYMMMQANVDDADALMGRFEPLRRWVISYRDVTPGPQTFSLYVEDCWKGLLRAKRLGWVDFGPNGFDVREYLHLDNPLNADLHEIVPGKLLAMRGPRATADGTAWRDKFRPDGSFSHRDFSPAHYADILAQFGVQAVVRLNVPQYDKVAFARAGIAVTDLFFEDCTSPPVDVVAKFLALAEALPGALAVHCQAGLGRTGTLIALYMMKHHGFSAREAMGWLRIVRPGSVIGEQQGFLCAREALMHRSAEPLRPAGDAHAAAIAAAAAEGDVETLERLIGDMVRVYDARYGRAVGGTAHGGRSGSEADLERRALAAHVVAASSRRGGARAMVEGVETAPRDDAGID